MAILSGVVLLGPNLQTTENHGFVAATLALNRGHGGAIIAGRITMF